MPEKRKRDWISAAEFIESRESDPAYQIQRREMERQQAAAVQEYEEAAAPLFSNLASAGFDVSSLDVLMNKQYAAAVPILVKWLPEIANTRVKESIVRTLSVPWAKSAVRPLLMEFCAAPESENLGLKWAIGSALEVLASDEMFEDLVGLLRDKRHGRAREMLAIALGKMKNPKAVDVLIELLSDDQVALHALTGLGKLKSEKAVPFIKPFLKHPRSAIARGAMTALRKIERAIGT